MFNSYLVDNINSYVGFNVTDALYLLKLSAERKFFFHIIIIFYFSITEHDTQKCKNVVFKHCWATLNVVCKS